MNRGKYRIGGLLGSAAAALVAGMAASAVEAQQAAPTPTPAPAPAPSRTPSVIYLPNVQPERFTLGTPAATPTPAAPAPTPTPSAAPAAAAPARTPARIAPAPRQPQAAPAPVAAEATPGAHTPPSTEIPAAVPAPLPSAPASPVPAQPAVAKGTPAWLWALLGAGAMALVFGAIWALRRRRPEAEAEAFVEPAVAPSPPAPARPVGPPPAITPPARAAAPSGEPFEIILQPQRIEVGEREVTLDFELLVGNIHGAPAENIRVSLALMSASPEQDRHIAGYHANPINEPGGAPFDLAPGAGGRMPARLALPREFIHVVEVGNRPMFVPMVMVELKWRSGISIRRFGADFMIGKAGQGAKLGPIWLDRNQQAGQLAATRYLPRQAAAA